MSRCAGAEGATRSGLAPPKSTSRPISLGRFVEAAHDALDDGVVVDPAGCGDHDVGCPVMLAVELGDLVARGGADRLLKA